MEGFGLGMGGGFQNGELPTMWGSLFADERVVGGRGEVRRAWFWGLSV